MKNEKNQIPDSKLVSPVSIVFQEMSFKKLRPYAGLFDKDAPTCKHLNGVGCKNPVSYQRDLPRLAFDSLSVERRQKLGDTAGRHNLRRYRGIQEILEIYR